MRETRLLTKMEKAIENAQPDDWYTRLDELYLTLKDKLGIGWGYVRWMNLANQFIEERKKLAELQNLSGRRTRND